MPPAPYPRDGPAADPAAGRADDGSAGDPAAPARREPAMLPGAAAGALLDGLPDPVVVVDRRTTVIEANRAARALLPGLRPGGALFFGLRHPDVLDGV